MDLGEISNPKKTLIRREKEAGLDETPKEEAKEAGVRFGKGYSETEKKKQAEALAKILRERR